jgi:P27 family predicted phage terminase small subunit
MPTAIRMQRGNPGRRPINTREPTPDPLDLEAPASLSPAAAVEWARLAPMLAARGHVTAADRAAFIGYCVKFAQWDALEAAARQAPFVVTAPSGYPIPNPAIGMANKVFTLLLKAAAELGLTPSSRSRVQAVKEPDAASPLAKLRAKAAAVQALRRVK